MPRSSPTAVLEVRDLQVWFQTRRGVGKAVDGVNFDLFPGETLGLMGESGSGKSLTALSLIGLNPKPASHVVGGQVRYLGTDLLALSPAKLAAFRGRHISMVLQDPMTALNPVLTIGEQVGEAVRVGGHRSGRSIREAVVELLRLLGIPGAKERLRSYPHQMSGGMRQRVVGAIALGPGPVVLVADEPTTSLDVTVQAAYLALLRDIQAASNLAILFITHDFGVVASVCDRVAVMYAGRIVESGPVERLFARPAHPYTQALLRSLPDLDKTPGRLYSIEGEPPNIYDVPTGCPFAPRCEHVMSRCREEYPPVTELEAGQSVHCWLWSPSDEPR